MHGQTCYEREAVFSSGDFNNTVSLILKGRIKLVANRDAGSGATPLEVARLEKGELLGESCLAHDTYRLNGTATEFTELLCMGKSDLNRLLERQPALGVKLLRFFLGSLSDKMSRTNESLRRTAEYDYGRVDEAVIEARPADQRNAEA